MGQRKCSTCLMPFCRLTSNSKLLRLRGLGDILETVGHDRCRARLSNTIEDRKFRNLAITTRTPRASRDLRVMRSNAGERVVANCPGYFEKDYADENHIGDFMSDVRFAELGSSLLATPFVIALAQFESFLRESWCFDLRTTIHGCPVISLVILTSHAGRSSHFFDRISTSRYVCLVVRCSKDRIIVLCHTF